MILSKIILGICISVIPLSLKSMESPATSVKPYQCCPASFGKVSTVSKAKTVEEGAQWAFRQVYCEPDTFTQYLCSSEQTADVDDVEYSIFIQNDIFKRMLVHVYDAHTAGHDSAFKIIDKISQRRIDPDTQQVAVTRRDWYHRLLAHIPWNGLADHGVCHPLLVKNKVFFLKITSCIHKQTVIKVCDEHTRVTTPVVDGDHIQSRFSNLLYK